MYNLLTQATVSAFLTRFNSFNDGVLRQVVHRYRRSKLPEALVTISTKDQQADIGWSNVVLAVEEVSEILFREGGSTRQILSDGLHVAWFGDDVWCDLSPYGPEPETMEDFRQSDFYIVGRQLAWRVEAYSEE